MAKNWILKLYVWLPEDMSLSFSEFISSRFSTAEEPFRK